MKVASPSVAPSVERRVNSAVSVVVNGILLWVAHQLLDWGWPSFLTRDFTRVLPLITLSLLVSIVGHVALFMWSMTGSLKQLIDLASAGFGVVIAVRLLRIFPFDFTTYDTDWSWLVRLTLIIALIVSALGLVVGTIRFLIWLSQVDDPRTSAQ